jgi:AraC-like DNA-binding protein
MQTITKNESRSVNASVPRYINQGHRVVGVPASNIKPLCKLMLMQGVPLESLLHNTNIALTDFTKINNNLLLEQFLTLITNARTLCNDPTYALVLGEQFYINHDGILSCRVMSSEHALAAMELLTQYQSLFTELLEFSLDVNDEYAIFSIVEKFPLGDALPHFVEYSYSVLSSLAKFCLANNEMKVELEFSYGNPCKGNEFQQFFNNPVRFNCSANRVIIPTSTLVQSIIFSNEQSAIENEKQCQKHLQQVRSEQKVIQDVKKTIRSLPFNEVSLEMLAQQLCMSTRSLRRHLQGQGVSYKTLLENERKRIALNRIEQQDISIDKLAELLGYNNASSFSRAFKRWFGISPHHYQQDKSDT